MKLPLDALLERYQQRQADKAAATLPSEILHGIPDSVVIVRPFAGELLVSLAAVDQAPRVLERAPVLFHRGDPAPCVS